MTTYINTATGKKGKVATYMVMRLGFPMGFDDFGEAMNYAVAESKANPNEKYILVDIQIGSTFAYVNGETVAVMTTIF